MNKKRRQMPIEHRAKRRSSVLRQHKRSVMIICAILVMLTGTLSVNAVGLYHKNEVYKQQEKELKTQIKEEKARSKEVEEYEAYVKTDEYIKSVAEKKLGLVDPSEIIFRAAE